MASKSLPAQSTPGSLSALLKAERRRSMVMARGQSEFAFYERLPHYGQSDGTDESDFEEDHAGEVVTGSSSHPVVDQMHGDSGSEEESDNQGEDNDVEMDDLDNGQEDDVEVCIPPLPTAKKQPTLSAKAKGKQKMVEPSSSASPGSVIKRKTITGRNMKSKALSPSPSTSTAMSTSAPASYGVGRSQESISAQEKARQQRREERKYSLNARRPVIVLRKDSGWSFSQEAFFPQYLRPQYALATNTADCSPDSYRASLADREYIDDELDQQPQITEIFISQEDSRRYLP